jgi:hypothetical protein
VKGLGSNVNHLLYQRESAQGPLMMQAQRKETARALESAIQGGKKRFQYVITRKKTKKKDFNLLLMLQPVEASFYHILHRLQNRWPGRTC